MQSINNLLKVTADWKVMPTSSVIDNVYDIVRVQYINVRRALYGQGNYALAPTLSRHSVTYRVWQGDDDKRKEELVC